MKYLLIMLILTIIGIFGCMEQKRDGVIHLSVCNEFPECYEVVDSSKGLVAFRCEQSASPFTIPCFKDSTKDTISFRMSILKTSHVNVEVLDNSERVIKVLLNGNMSAGYHTFFWSNRRDGEIYGCRMFSQGNEMTYWFVAD